MHSPSRKHEGYLFFSPVSQICISAKPHIQPKFELGLKVKTNLLQSQSNLDALANDPKIIDLNNIPLVAGTSYIKWHLPSSNSAEHRGRTPKASIKDHKVNWDYEKTIPVRLTIDRNAYLQDSEIHFEVLQEYSSGARGERILLGNVKLNLAEYVEGSDDTDGGITRRYLMQESKINSTLKISISMKQIDGDRNFIAPPLKTARVFGGIAGIMNAEQGEPDDLGHMPSMSSKTREIGELQDMYRRTLAASWAAQAGELPADECIENIFAGGDGWGKQKAGDQLQVSGGIRGGESTNGDDSDGDFRAAQGHRRNSSGFGRRANTKQRSHIRTGSKEHDSSRDSGGVSGRGSIEQQTNSSSAEEKRRSYRKVHEIDEFDVREDLRSWEISTPS
ncbi:MAG: hypothetical protein Q9187_005695 [Circinaria calcarea]